MKKQPNLAPLSVWVLAICVAALNWTYSLENVESKTGLMWQEMNIQSLGIILCLLVVFFSARSSWSKIRQLMASSASVNKKEKMYYSKWYLLLLLPLCIHSRYGGEDVIDGVLYRTELMYGGGNSFFLIVVSGLAIMLLQLNNRLKFLCDYGLEAKEPPNQRV